MGSCPVGIPIQERAVEAHAEPGVGLEDVRDSMLEAHELPRRWGFLQPLLFGRWRFVAKKSNPPKAGCDQLRDRCVETAQHGPAQHQVSADGDTQVLGPTDDAGQPDALPLRSSGGEPIAMPDAHLKGRQSTREKGEKGIESFVCTGGEVNGEAAPVGVVENVREVGSFQRFTATHRQLENTPARDPIH